MCLSKWKGAIFDFDFELRKRWCIFCLRFDTTCTTRYAFQTESTRTSSACVHTHHNCNNMTTPTSIVKLTSILQLPMSMPVELRNEKFEAVATFSVTEAASVAFWCSFVGGLPLALVAIAATLSASAVASAAICLSLMEVYLVKKSASSSRRIFSSASLIREAFLLF